jgi:DNA mismatch repair protein MutS
VSDLVFLYRVSPGVAEKSYGVYAAKLAGLPRPVVRRAEELLSHYEAHGHQPEGKTETAAKEHETTNASPRASEIAQALLGLDLDTLSPVEALTKLYELRRLAELEKPQSIRAIKTA